MGGHHQDQDSSEDVLVNNVVPSLDGVNPDTQRQDVQNVGKNDSILGSIWRERRRQWRESGDSGEGREGEETVGGDSEEGRKGGGDSGEKGRGRRQWREKGRGRRQWEETVEREGKREETEGKEGVETVEREADLC